MSVFLLSKYNEIWQAMKDLYKHMVGKETGDLTHDFKLSVCDIKLQCKLRKCRILSKSGGLCDCNIPHLYQT